MFRIAEQQQVGDRNERSPLPARGHVARAEIAHHPNSESFRQHRGFAQLPGDQRRLVPDGLAVHRDEPEIGGPHPGFGEERFYRLRAPEAQLGVKPGKVRGSGPVDPLRESRSAPGRRRAG